VQSKEQSWIQQEGVNMNSRILGAASIILLVANAVMAQDKIYPKAKVSFDDFKNIVSEVEPHRANRLIDLDTFLKWSKEQGVITLDTRSTFRYERIHLKGAKHLSFTDFTQDNLGKVIPSFETMILIYCNNNFEGDEVDFASKVAKPTRQPSSPEAAQFKVQEKPRMMALNIPTYINLYGYGYHNVYELDELVDVNDSRITFEGSIVKQSRSRKP
jgi:rhodanese-like protein